MHKVFSTAWNVVINLGIKCNAAPISKGLNQRYVSSPFDNMDSVEGLVEAAELISSRFCGYFSARDKWRLRNDRGSKSLAIRTKIAWHEDYPNLYYPHFYAGWIDGGSPEAISSWVSDEEGSLDFVWSGLMATFSARAERLVSLLDSGARVLFVRIDERSQLRRLQRRDRASDTMYFCERLRAVFPAAELGFLYLYSEGEGEALVNRASSVAYLQPMPRESDEPAFAADFLRQLKVSPRDELKQFISLESRRLLA